MCVSLTLRLLIASFEAQVGMFFLLFIEHCLRSEDKPLFGAIASRQSDCVSALVRLAAVSGHVSTTAVVKQHCVTLLAGKSRVSSNELSCLCSMFREYEVLIFSGYWFCLVSINCGKL
jgi:hypothetical protein